MQHPALPSRRLPRIALVTTVLNEPRLIRDNLLYHHWLGVEHCYVYNDGCTDHTFDLVRDLPFVQILPTAEPRQFVHRRELAGPVRNHATHVPARQELNICQAIELARCEGYDWLLSLDVDELVCLDRRQQRGGQLADFLGGVSRWFEQVIFAPLEIVQTEAEYDDVFRQARLFLEPWLRIPRPMYDPYTQQDFLLPTQFLGHRWGKPAMRLSADLYPFSLHRFTRRTGVCTAPTRLARDLLHYNAYDYHDFIKKFKAFRKEPDNWYHGRPMGREKRLWRDLVNDPRMSEQDLRDYFLRAIVRTPAQLAPLSRRRWLCKAPGMRPLAEVTSVGGALAAARAQFEAPPAATGDWRVA